VFSSKESSSTSSFAILPQLLLLSLLLTRNWKTFQKQDLKRRIFHPIILPKTSSRSIPYFPFHLFIEPNWSHHLLKKHQILLKPWNKPRPINFYFHQITHSLLILTHSHTGLSCWITIQLHSAERIKLFTFMSFTPKPPSLFGWKFFSPIYPTNFATSRTA